MMIKSVFVIVGVLLLVSTSVDAYQFKKGSSSSNVVVEAHLDLMSPECATAYVALDELEGVEVVGHLLPMPQNTRSWETALASLDAAVGSGDSDEKWWNFVGHVFRAQASLAEKDTDAGFVEEIESIYSGYDKETAARYSPELEASWKEAVEAGINTVPYVTVNGVYIGGTPQDIVDAVAASKANFKPMESTSIGVALVPLFIICICCAGGVAGAYKILAPALAGNASAAFPAMGRANGPIVAGGVVQEPRTRFVDHSSSGDASDDLDGSRFAAGLAPLSDEDSV